MLNKVILIGRLTSDIELRHTQDGLSFTYFTLAVNRRMGKEGSKTDFIPCIAWKTTADLMKNYLKKGSLIAVEGRVEVYSSKDENNNFNTRVNVNVSQINFLESKKTTADNNYSKEETKKEKIIFNEEEETKSINFEDIDFDNIEF